MVDLLAVSSIFKCNTAVLWIYFINFLIPSLWEKVLYKSRCDNRLNEIVERTSADKREVPFWIFPTCITSFIHNYYYNVLSDLCIFQVESLSKKYEEKYKQGEDVASKLTIEEATFRDIQVSLPFCVNSWLI